MLYLIRRGRENLREMSKDTFIVGTDASGRKYVTQKMDELDKNHRGQSDKNFDTSGEGLMYETKDELCPVVSFNSYIQKLNPELNCLWQRPLANINENTGMWYYNAPLGVNTLGNMMANMSKKYNLSQRYTNHCLRATTISILDSAGIQGRHSIRVSGHKAEESLKSYSRTITNARKREISDIVHTSVHDTDKKETSLDKENQEAGLDKENQDPDTKNQTKDLTEVTLFDVPDIVDISDQDLVAASQIIDNQVMEANMRSNTDFTLSHTNITQLPGHLNQPINIQHSSVTINYNFSGAP